MKVAFVLFMKYNLLFSNNRSGTEGDERVGSGRAISREQHVGHSADVLAVGRQTRANEEQGNSGGDGAQQHLHSDGEV
jgi:hypothetical protein